MTDYRATFDLIDANGDGTIDVSELSRLMELLGQDASFTRVVEVMVTADKTRDGKLSYEEFAAFMEKAQGA